MKTTHPGCEIQVLADASALAEFASAQMIQIAKDAVAVRSRFCIALAGGSTPHLLYTSLTQSEKLEQINWSSVQIYWGDERCVPPDDPDSNYLMARQALLDHVPLPAENVHRICGELEPERAAQMYQAELRQVSPGAKIPRFDLVLLGLGEDGHIASLFPGSSALSETKRWVVSVEHTVPPPPLVTRISLTLPVFNAAANLIVLVSGSRKAGIFSRLMQRIDRPNGLPAQLIRPKNGHLVWVVDRLAAGEYLK